MSRSLCKKPQPLDLSKLGLSLQEGLGARFGGAPLVPFGVDEGVPDERDA